MSETKLLPCPFCGSEKHMVLGPTCDRSTPYNPNDRAFPMIRCGGCYTDVPGKDWDSSGLTAVEAWNRRTAAPDLLTAAKEALSTLKTASRQLTEDHKMVLMGRGWGWKTLANLEGAISKAEGSLT